MLATLKAAPLPVVLLVLSFLCPTELSLYISGLRLPPHRVALILVFPFAIARIFKRGTKVRAFDGLFFLFAAWSIYVYYLHAAQDGLVYGGSLALESLGAYLVARAYVRDQKTLRATLKLLVVAILIAAAFAIPEALGGHIYTHDILARLTGYVHPTGIEQRLGLTRAYGTFDHPIHYGTFCAAGLAMLWYAEKRSANRRNRALWLLAATMLGLSSAPLLCLGVQGALLGWDRLTRTTASRKMVTAAILFGLYVGISLVSNRGPFALIATGLTLDPWTGFYRLQIWENGLNNVYGSPWIGIGLADWERPAWMVSATIDAFWLVTMMRTGLPALVLLALAILSLAYAVERQKRMMADKAARKLATGWQISMIALILVGCTVHYWNVLHAFFFFIVGLGGWAGDLARSETKAYAKAKAAKEKAARSAHRPASPDNDSAPWPDAVSA